MSVPRGETRRGQATRTPEALGKAPPPPPPVAPGAAGSVRLCLRTDSPLSASAVPPAPEGTPVIAFRPSQVIRARLPAHGPSSITLAKPVLPREVTLTGSSDGDAGVLWTASRSATTSKGRVSYRPAVKRDPRPVQGGCVKAFLRNQGISSILRRTRPRSAASSPFRGWEDAGWEGAVTGWFCPVRG